jgi:hypothetical protein
VTNSIKPTSAIQSFEDTDREGETFDGKTILKELAKEKWTTGKGDYSFILKVDR